jgi:hypothetical protein
VSNLPRSKLCEKKVKQVYCKTIESVQTALRNAFDECTIIARQYVANGMPPGMTPEESVEELDSFTEILTTRNEILETLRNFVEIFVIQN